MVLKLRQHFCSVNLVAMKKLSQCNKAIIIAEGASLANPWGEGEIGVVTPKKT